MLSILEIFRIVATEFDYLEDDFIEKRIELAKGEVAGSKIKTHIKNEMIAYLVAHYLTISEKRKGAGGEISSISEGDLSISYSTSGINVKYDLNLTSYGRIYLRKLKSHTITPMTRVIC